MAAVGPITVPLNFEVTETSQALINGLVAKALLDDLSKGEESDIRAFVRTEVRKALADVVQDIREGVSHD